MQVSVRRLFEILIIVHFAQHMLKITLISLAVLVVIFLIVVAMQPTDFRITRSASFAAPAPVVFEQFNDFHKWNAWSPWAKMDPDAKNTFEGPAAGIGSGFKWAGNSKVGEGHMTITDSTPDSRIVIRLEFIKPFAAVNTTEFTFKPKGNQTAVTWTMSGKNSFMGKAVVLVMNCDKMVGGQFEDGLANLKAIVETPATKL